MNLSAPFIKRPIMTTLIMTGIVFFGAMAYELLPISDLPSIKYPTISVFAINPGSDPQMMADNVAIPLEKELMAIDGLENIVSTSTQGTTRITLNFNLDKDVDTAAIDVNAAINRAQGRLPSEMPILPTYEKTNPTDTPVFYLAATSETMTLAELYEYGNTLISQRLSMLEGVSKITVYGSPKATRIKLNPERMAAMQIGIDEVTNAIVTSSQALPAGNVYNERFSYTINTHGQITDGKDFNNTIVAMREGSPVFLKDIGQSIDSNSIEHFYLKFWSDTTGEKPTIVIAVSKVTGYNTVKLCDTIKSVMPKLQEELPASIKLAKIFDASNAIKEGIWDIKFTLIIAFLLVVIVIFLFLGKVSSTIIPTVALPISIIGTFSFMYLYGFSIDILSMMAITLVIGFLVDDAIVVLENIIRHMEMGKTPLQASLDGTKQISSTVLSMTLSLTAVFIPLIFMPGIVGKMFQEFSIVVVIAVLFSGFISLTLTPMLCALFLKQSKTPSKLEAFAHKLMEKLLRFYEPILHFVLKRPLLPIGVAGASFLAAIYLFTSIPKDFLPAGDTGAIQGITIAAQGVSYEEMTRLQDAATAIIKTHPAVKSVLSITNIPRYIAANQGFVFISLKEGHERAPIDAVAGQLMGQLMQVPGLMTFLKPMPQINLNVGTGVERAQYTYTLSTADEPEELYRLTQSLTRTLQSFPELNGVSTDVQMMNPQLNVHVDRNRASVLGVSVKKIEEALYTAYSGARISTYNTPQNIYDIIVELEDAYKKDPSALNKLRLTSNLQNEHLIPLGSVVHWEESVGPTEVNHNSQFTSASIFFNVNPGTALSTALDKVADTAAKTLPPSIMRNYVGQAGIFQSAVAGMSALILICILLIYLLLGSLYESFIHPITILSTLPGALFGGLITLLIFGGTLSIYAYVGMIVLIGIVLKNGIMLVEFATEQVHEGKTPYDAIVEACRERFRPILMTTLAAAMGAVPIALGIGADAASRRPLGLVVVGGLIFAQLITYFFTPVVYLYMEKWQKKLMRK